MHSCSIIMAAGSHGSAYNGAVRLGFLPAGRPATRCKGNNNMNEAWGETSGATGAELEGLIQQERYVDSKGIVAPLRLHPTA